jgi:hypothetical protein
MAHKLGLPRHRTEENAAPLIQQPVFLHDQHTHKIAPFRVLYPSYWARVDEGGMIPILPEQVAGVAGDALGEKPDAKEFPALQPLTQEQILQVLQKLADAPPPPIKPADSVSSTARGVAIKGPGSSSQPSRDIVYVTGGKAYRNNNGKLISSDHDMAEPYAWALAHDVRGAQQSLGARGCTECHTNGAPVFDSTVNTASVLPVSGKNAAPMHELRHDRMSAMRVFNATYPLRWPLIVIGYLSAFVLLLVYLKQKLRTIGGGE